jgi:uncharacterized protein (TIGR00297 family)
VQILGIPIFIRMNELLTSPTTLEWTSMLFILAGIIMCVAAIEIVRKHFGWSVEITRKFLHISVGLLIFFAPVIFKSALIPLLLSSFTVLAMLIAVRTGLLVSIHSTSRFSYGAIFYSLSFFVLIIVFWDRNPEIISLSMLSLATGDAAAAIVGESFQSVREYKLTSDRKSIEGSIAMFAVTSISLFCGMIILKIQTLHSMEYLAIITLVAASIATAFEAVSSKGLDNFTIPLSVAFVLSFYLIPSRMQDPDRFTAGILWAMLIAVSSYHFKFLSASGSVAVFILASIIYGLGGLQWTVPILTFFILSSLLSNAGKKRKSKFEHIFEKTSTRDLGQVAANGGIAGMLMLAQYISPENNFYPAYLGTIAAVTADTWGTEIGIWVGGKTILLSLFKVVEPGTNGGISLAGFIGSTIGAFVISISAFPWVMTNKTVFIAAFAGIAGSLLDSILGGTMQSVYRCSICGKNTERRLHCNSATTFVKGIRWITNDAVNWSCAFTGAIIAWMMY